MSATSAAEMRTNAVLPVFIMNEIKDVIFAGYLFFSLVQAVKNMCRKNLQQNTPLNYLQKSFLSLSCRNFLRQKRMEMFGEYFLISKHLSNHVLGTYCYIFYVIPSQFENFRTH